MGSLFRSEEMALCQLFLQAESAYSIAAQMGELGVAQFRDLNASVNAFQRKYVGEIRRCEEMERKLRYIESEIKQAKIPIQESDDSPTVALQQREIIEMEAKVDKVENEIREVHTNTQALKKSNVELVELVQVLRVTQQFFDEGMAPSQQNFVAMSHADEESGHAPFSEGTTTAGGGRLTCVAGVVAHEKVLSMERMLWRCSRGNVYFRYIDIGEIEDPETGIMVDKCVYVMFCPGSQLEARTKKICEAFHATIYPCPDTTQARREMSVGIMTRLTEYETVLKQSKEHRDRLLTAAAKHLNSWKKSVRKVKAIFHTLNLFDLDVTQKCLIAECWIPVRDLDIARKAVTQGTVDSGSNVTSIINRLDSDETPPTYNRVNKFTSGFQNIVDAYGVANYREVNPTPFTIITFPFLFAIMFGDVGHGLLMMAFAAFLVIREKQLQAAKIRDEIFSTFFGGRYIILLMGIFSVYTGTIYNDFFSKAVNVFGSTWLVPYDNKTLSAVEKLTMDPNSKAFLGYPYPYGFDPIWIMSKNKLNFLNSFKMKMSVILGILQMLLGVFLSLLNYKYFRSALDVTCQFLPQVLFLSCIFVYLCCMIMHKWIVFPAGEKQVAIGLYPGSHCAPSLLIGLINMFMLKSRPEGFEGRTCSVNAYYPRQVIVETILLLIALACVPWMLLAKPLILKMQHSRKKGRVDRQRSPSPKRQPDLEKKSDQILDFAVLQGDIQMTVLTNDGDGGAESNIGNHDVQKGTAPSGSSAPQGHSGGHGGHGEEFSFGEVFIHQAIHTIEYCLGCISHTASYLRLWALSLAHAELSEVLWNMVMQIGFHTETYIGVPVIYAIFFAFGCLTLAILVIMEGLSAFLHALRLHWVEFQSKFYGGTGCLFEPFSFKRILEEAEEQDVEAS